MVLASCLEWWQDTVTSSIVGDPQLLVYYSKPYDGVEPSDGPARIVLTTYEVVVAEYAAYDKCYQALLYAAND